MKVNKQSFEAQLKWQQVHRKIRGDALGSRPVAGKRPGGITGWHHVTLPPGEAREMGWGTGEVAAEAGSHLEREVAAGQYVRRDSKLFHIHKVQIASGQHVRGDTDPPICQCSGRHKV